MKAKLLIATGMVISSLMAPLAVSAQVRAETGAPIRDPLAIYRQVGISAEQESKIRQLSKEYEDAARVRDERLKNLLIQMHELSLQPAPDEQATLAKQDEINKVQAESSIEKIKFLLAIRNQLSAEQKQRLVSIMEERARQGAQAAMPQ